MKKTTIFSTSMIVLVILSQTLFAQSEFSVSKKSTNDTLLIIKDDGKVGIGTTSPTAELQVEGIDGVLFTGTLDNGTIPVEGIGVRMMWYPRKAAFRAGYVNSTFWNDINIGFYSTAFGMNTTASGSYSTAMGYRSSATGRYSTAMGYLTTAGGDFSTAIGRQIQANSDYSVAIALSNGENVQVTQDSTMAIIGGKVGIGTIAPSTELEVVGTIQSSSGGFMFPDGTVQATASAGSLWNLNGSNIYYNSGNVGIGTSTPAYPLTIFPGTNSRGLYIDHNQTGTGTTYGIFVDLDRTSTGDANVYGVYSTATNNNGVWSARGLMATADGNASGPKYGVYAVAQGSGNLYGVKGVASSTGLTPQYGVWGEAIGSGTGVHYGVYGTTSGGGSNHWAGFFNGNVYADGNVGIGTTSPFYKLSVAGTIQSSNGGFMFPDGTTQTTAAIGGGGASSIDDLTDGKTGGNSVFLGSGAGGNDDGSDNRNTAVGINALYTNTTGSYNTAVGVSALALNTIGRYNTANGVTALNFNTEGYSNTANGYWALYSNTTGDRNVGLGLGANRYNQEGSENTIIGCDAGRGTVVHNKSGNVFLGYQAGYYETGDNKLYIENTLSNTPLIGGDFATNKVNLNGEVYVRDRFGVGTTLPGAGMHLVGNGYPNSFMFLEATSGGDAGFRLYEGTADKWHIFNNATLDGLQIYNDNGINVLFADQSTGNVGIGDVNPLSKLHVTNNDISLPNTALLNEIITVEGSDAGLGLYSTNGGSYGSVISLGEITTGTLNNKWSIFRTTSIANPANQLRFSFGTNANYSLNPRIMVLSENGNVGIGTTNPTSLLTVAGTVECDVLEIRGGSDIAEPFDIKHTIGIKAGMVMAIDPENPGKLKISENAYDRCVAGIISGAGGINPGMIMGQSGSVADGEFPVALTGRVYCQADASNGSIQPGDLLTTSDIPGHAMKVFDYNKAQGAVIGKAMSSLNEGQGLILVLVSLQ